MATILVVDDHLPNQNSWRRCWAIKTIAWPRKRMFISTLAGARELGSGKLDTRIEVKTGDELEQLAGAFAQMAADLHKTLVSRADLLKEVAERKQAEERPKSKPTKN